MKKFICESCTFEWEGPVEEVSCPFCNSMDIVPYRPPFMKRCSACAYVWTEVKPSRECPVCGSRDLGDHLKPHKVTCQACSHQWIARDDYPVCPQCEGEEIRLDYCYDEHYDVILEDPGEMIKQVIQTVADLCTVDIPRAAAMIGRCPICIMDNLDDIEATQLKIRFEDLGARVTLRPSEQGTP